MLKARNPIVVDAELGISIDKALSEALNVSGTLKTEIILVFNSKRVSCDARRDTLDKLVKYYLSS